MISAIKTSRKHFTLMAFVCCMMLPFPNAHAVGLKENSILMDDTITLGDVFYDLKRDENRVLGAAPRPGKDIVLNAKTLLRISLAMGLDWRPTNKADHITLSRAATIIEYDQIKESLYTALYDENIYGDYELSIPQQYHQIILPHNQPRNMSITAFSVDAARKTFQATIAAPSADNPIQHFQITGTMHSIITVPVLTENLQYGHVISTDDIKYIKIKEQAFTRDMIADANILIGMTARRIIIAGRPIKKSDTVAPQLIERGELVTLSLNSNIMNLTTQAKALENGAKGDIIRVVNTASNKTLQAMVTGANQVTILQN